ncbi:HAD-IC family P-type ATPase [Candidatus Nanohaloarchaea archaeon]|nr:HAD-IC family P-type ATPase [Candidatus Nanohaloarchaea archaeon]
MTNWHSKKLDEVVQKLDTSTEEGLASEEAEKRLEEEGANEIEKGEEVHPLEIFLGQFKDFLIYLLFFAAIVSIAIGFFPGHEPEYVNAALILIIVFLTGIFGFFQDYKAEKSIEALKELSKPDITVLRDGKKIEVSSSDIVPGDVIILNQGDSIPADARLVESESLYTDESALTGESENVSKSPGEVEEDSTVAERSNMVFKNTSVVKGRGKAVVVETGMNTEVGDIAEQLQGSEDEKTDFQKEVDEMGRKIGYGIVAVILMVAVVEFSFTSASIVTIFLMAVSLAVAAVPVSLPAVVTLTLALGSRKMLEKDALVRRLSVVESLGSIDTIVTDKTGTLTEDLMTVEKLYFGSEEFEVTGSGTSIDGEFHKDGHGTDVDYLTPLLRCGLVCNNAEKAPEEEEKDYYGEPTEIALLVSGLKAGLNPDVEREREIPFSSDRKRMTVVTGENEAYMKGAPETVLERCDRFWDGEKEVEMTDDLRQEIKDKNNEMASSALRVLGFAKKDVQDVDADSEEVESNMVFLGLQGMIDPPRQEVGEAVQDCREAGIHVTMATGDRAETAQAIGEEIGFNADRVVTGQEIEEMSDEELQEEVKETEIFARVEPRHKVMILEALEDNGRKVAMTGDGVNDAPALKKSSVGIAMGKRGTDVAKQSSDMVLQDDNFVTIRDAIAEGRGIFDNIRKFVNYLLSANAGEVLTVFFGILLGAMFFPSLFQNTTEAVIMTPIMLIWFNFVTDGLPALAIGSDDKSEGIMNRKPRGTDEPVINKRMVASMVGIGIIMAATGLTLFFSRIEAGYSLAGAQTMLFTFFVMIELVRIQTIRQRYEQSFLSNRWLVAAIGSSILLQLMVIYTPLHKYFEVTPLGVPEWAAIGGAVTAFVVFTLGMINLYDRVFPEE